MNVVVSCPIDTYSGYGARSRDLVKALIETRPDWDIKILPQRWGNTRWGYLSDHNDKLLKPRILSSLTYKPDIWIQITIPNEFQPVGTFNIGVTAGIESTLCHGEWVAGCNRMNLIVTSSEFAKNTLASSIFSVKDQRTGQSSELKLSTPVEVLFEGVNTQVYRKVDGNDGLFDLSLIKEDFCFLVTGHWMQGDLGHDRKNIGYTVKAFLETFKNSPNKPALILKTSKSTSSIIDRESILDKIDFIKKTVNGEHANIYLLHGEISDEEMNLLYNHPKVKVLLSLTKGEGFGRPLLEFTQTGKPVIASGWSGHTEFLNKEYSTLIGGVLEEIHPSAAVKDLLLKEARWFKPDDGSVGKVLKDIFKNYKKYTVGGKKQGYECKVNFSYEKMKEKLSSILDKNVQVPKLVQLEFPKLNLPKLEKID